MDLSFPGDQRKAARHAVLRMPSSFVFIQKKLFWHTPVTGLAISMLNGYIDIVNAFKFVVITLTKCD